MKEKTGPLKGLRVIDFGQYIAGPAAAMILADYGADVIHIDPPGGPRWNDYDVNAVLMRGKRNISLDLKDLKDREIALKLIDTADIVIENFRPGVMDRLGLGWEECHKRDPQLVYCSLPGFSKDDKKRREWQGWEGIVSADGGLYNGRDPVNGEWIRFDALPLASLFAAVIACHSIIAALIVREKSGQGQYVESSLYDACFEVDSTRGVDKQVPMLPGGLTRPKDMANGSLITRMMIKYPCKDGRYIQITPPPRGYRAICTTFFPKEWFTEGPPANAEEIVKEVMLTKTMKEWEEYCQTELGAGVASSLTSEEWMHEAHAQDSRTVIHVDDPVLGETLQPGVPALMLRSGDCAGAEPRHAPDADREEILSELKSPAKKKKYGDGPVEPPLKGIKVLDLSQVVAGPTAGRIFAEYGAEVLKINNPRLLDNFTALAGYETQYNGKKTIFLDLKSEEGKAVMEDLIREYDVFHCNFAQAAYQHLHYTEEELLARNPRMILSQINIHSLGGGREWYRGHEDLGEAITGMSVRYSGTYRPQTLSLLVLDHLTGQMSVLGVLLALYDRMLTGKPQRTQSCLSRSSTWAQIPFMLSYKGKVWDEPAGPKATGYGPLNRIFKACDKEFFLCADVDELRKVPELKELSDDENAAAKALESIFAGKEREYWLSTLRENGISVSPCRLFKLEFAGDEYAFERGIAKVEDHPGIGTLRTTHCGPRMSLTPPKPCYPSHMPGMDTEEFLAEYYKAHPKKDKKA
ncbi:MAG: CoA transferase [Firmicutes bacterium]|nr:CoA transferase [Bacillota bacterium]